MAFEPVPPRGILDRMTDASPHVSVVIPVYRSEFALQILCERLTAALAHLDGGYEIIFVDDRSPDGSWRLISRLAKEFPTVKAVRLSRNFGQHYAITAGLDIAAGDWVVVMDGDLQDRPEEIPSLLAKGEEGFDIVLAQRSERADALGKRASSSIFYRCFSLLSGFTMDPSVGTFRIMRRPVVEALRSMRESRRLFGGFVQWVGFDTGYVQVQHDPRPEGTSSYGWGKLLKLALDGIVAFSNRPLYLSIAIGFFVSLVSAAYGISLVIGFLIDRKVGIPGWLSTMTVTSFIGGLILLNLGITGIYVGRIYDETKRRPLYVIDAILPAQTEGH
jgi:polyisoprenyl-phosphate glycosyltransferase